MQSSPDIDSPLLAVESQPFSSPLSVHIANGLSQMFLPPVTPEPDVIKQNVKRCVLSDLNPNFLLHVCSVCVMILLNVCIYMYRVPSRTKQKSSTATASKQIKNIQPKYAYIQCIHTNTMHVYLWHNNLL